ncbi:MAG: cytochrome P450 [Patulibacter sp.]|nr:cytochrome P450 [Patulibacter sp.]
MTATAIPTDAGEHALRPASDVPPSPQRSGWKTTRRWIAAQADAILDLHGQFGDIATVAFAGGRGGVITRSADDVKKLFTADPADVPVATAGSPIGPFVGEHSLLTLNGRRHLRQRRLLLPPFHGDRMRGYAADIQDIAGAVVDEWQAGTTIKLQPQMQAITLEVILRIVFGVSDGARHDELKAAIIKLLALTENRWVMLPTFILATRAGRLFGPVAQVSKEVDRLIYRELDSRREAPDLERRTDILSMLLTARDEDGEPMSQQELRDELVTLLFAGHETTASQLSWTFERLVRHPEAMAAAVEAAKHGDPDGVIDATFQEALRLRPVVPVTARMVQRPFELSGYTIPAEKLVIVSILGLNRHPDRYERPEEFDPTRYAGGKMDTYTWIPFGGGVRRCIGAAFAMLEGREVLREVLRRTTLEAVHVPDERMKRRNVTMVPSEGALVNVIRVDR